MPLQFFQEQEKVIGQNQIDKFFYPVEISALDFSLITRVEDSFNLRMLFLFTLDDILTKVNLYGDCLLECQIKRSK